MDAQIGGSMVVKTLFIILLVLTLFVGLASLVAYPGPFVATAFALGGLPVWVLADRQRWITAATLAALAWVVPVWLLIIYTGDGDFTISSVSAHIVVLSLLAYGFAWAGMEAGRVVWREEWEGVERPPAGFRPFGAAGYSRPGPKIVRSNRP
jgi:hypothetical protein